MRWCRRGAADPADSRRLHSRSGAAQRVGDGELGIELVDQTLLYWSDFGWQRGAVKRLCPSGGRAFSHVIADTRHTSAPRDTADTLFLSPAHAVCPGPTAWQALTLRSTV